MMNKQKPIEKIVYFVNSLRDEGSTILGFVFATLCFFDGYMITNFEQFLFGVSVGGGLQYGTVAKLSIDKRESVPDDWTGTVVYLVKNLEETTTTLLTIIILFLGVLSGWIPEDFRDTAFGLLVGSSILYGTGGGAALIIESLTGKNRKQIESGSPSKYERGQDFYSDEWLANQDSYDQGLQTYRNFKTVIEEDWEVHSQNFTNEDLEK